MRSMTGHGRGRSQRGDRAAIVEIRAVNHRFLDLKFRGQSLDPILEDRVQQAIRGRADRGAFTVMVRKEGGGEGAGARVDASAARGMLAAIEDLGRILGRDGEVSLEFLASQPGIIVSGEETVDVDFEWALYAPAVEDALLELTSMRKREGAALAQDISDRLARLESLAVEISHLAAVAPEEWRRRLTERVQKLLSGTQVPVDESRLANEIALLADRLDVTEEVVRLRSHVSQARSLLPSDAPVGRRLDFLVQELGREINTIGSKAQSAEITRRVVDAKAELEKIREQVQNVE
ncbi:MAG: YicC family protein [Deltaproteobacteria bacterium]|nr:YicC family protein [Deltaproteobacteria bacterium]